MAAGAIYRFVDGLGPAQTNLEKGLRSSIPVMVIATTVIAFLSRPEPRTVESVGLACFAMLVGLSASISKGPYRWGRLAVLTCWAATVLAQPSSSTGHAGQAMAYTTLLAVVAGVLVARLAGPLILVGGISMPVLAHFGIVSGGPAFWADSAVLNVGLACGVGVSTSWLMLVAGQRDEAAADLLTVRRLEVERDARREARRRARGLLHDEVLAALRLVAQLPDREVAMVRATCRSALVAIRSGVAAPTPSDTVAVMAEAQEFARSLGLHPEVKLNGVPQVPVDSIPLLLGAVREALRNVDRHSGSKGVELRLEDLPNGGCLTISDRGIGLPESWTPGFGVESTIGEAMAKMGGQVNMASRPGGGAEVTLVWRGEPDRAVSGADEGGSPRIRQFAVTAAGVTGIVQSYLALRHIADAERPQVMVGVLAVLLLALMTGAARAGRPMGRSEIVSWSFGGCAVMGIGLWGAGTGAATDFTSWPLGFASLVLTLVALGRSHWVLFSMTFPPLILVAAWVIADEVATLLTSQGSLASVCLPTTLFWWIDRQMTRLSDQTRADDDRRLIIEASRLRLAAAEKAEEVYLANSLREVVPFLEVIQESNRPLSAADRARAALLAHSVRDDLYVAGTLEAATRDLVTSTRARGVRVRLEAQLSGVRIAGPAERVLHICLSTVRDDGSIAVGLDGSAPNGIRVAVTPGLSESVAQGICGVGGSAIRIASDDEVTVVRVILASCEVDLPKIADVPDLLVETTLSSETSLEPSPTHSAGMRKQTC